MAIEYFDEAPTYTPPQSNANLKLSDSRQTGTSQDDTTAALSPQLVSAHANDADSIQSHEPSYPQFDPGSRSRTPRDYTRQKAFTGSGAGESGPQHWLNPGFPLVQETAEQRVQCENMAAKQV